MLEESDAHALLSAVSTKDTKQIARVVVKIKPLINEVLGHLKIVVAEDAESVESVDPGGDSPTQRLSPSRSFSKDDESSAPGSRKDILICYVCSRKFTKQIYLNVHMRQHQTSKAPWKHRMLARKESNKISSPKFPSTALTVYNYRELSSAAPAVQILGPDFVESRAMYSCIVCQRLLEDQEALGWHYLHHLGILQFNCRFCEIRFKHPDSRSKHERGCSLNPDAHRLSYQSKLSHINGTTD